MGAAKQAVDPVMQKAVSNILNAVLSGNLVGTIGKETKNVAAAVSASQGYDLDSKRRTLSGLPPTLAGEK